MDRISFRPIEAKDLELLADWLAAPHVKAWWPDAHDLEAVRTKYTPMVEHTDSTQGFVVEADGHAIGFLQCYAIVDEPEWQGVLAAALGDSVDLRGARGIDYLIGDLSYVGRGVGTAMLASFAEATWRAEPKVTSLVVAVQQGNMASWRALEHAGFERLWSGTLESDDPSDQGPAHAYVHRRPA